MIMKTMVKMKMKIGPLKRPRNRNRSRLQNKAEEIELEVKETHAHSEVEVEVKQTHVHRSTVTVTETEAAPALLEKANTTYAAEVEVVKVKEAASDVVHNDMSALLMQVAKEEAAGTEAKPTTEIDTEAGNALTLPEKADKTEAVEVEAEEVTEATPVLAHNDKSAMFMQAFEVAKEEAAGTETETMLGDMEITLNSIKPKPTPVKTLRMTEESPTFQDASSPPPLSTRSPTSQFEYDVMNATHQNLDFDHLQKSYSYSLMDEDKSISSEDSIVSEAEHTHDTDGAGAEDDEQSDGGLPAFVNHVLTPMAPLSDYMFCRMKSDLPDIVEDVSEFLSKDLHHLVFNCECEGEEAAQDESVMEAEDDTQAEEKVDAEKTQEQEHKEGLAEKEEDGVETAWGTCPDGQGGGIRAGMQARFECASYNPVTGFVLRKEGRPEPAGDEVLIRVDATTISSRDCNERLRRDSGNKTNPMEFINNNTGLIEFWVPGHEIVGHVMRTGTDAGAENLLGKRVAALLPYGGGCSQYACVSAKDVIVLPVAANSTEVVALLSSYMAAYQCLDTVVGIEPKAEDGVESESEGDETEFQSVAVVPSDVDDDVKSNGESFDCSIASSLKEEDVEWERKGKIADDTESNLFSQQYNEEDSEHEPKEDERVTQKESTVDVEPKNEENIHGEEPKIKDDAKVNDAESMKEDGNGNEVKPEEDDNVKPKAEEDTESESKAKGEEVVDVEVQDMSLVMNSGGPKLSPLYGMKVLVVGALSSVGLALVDLARNAGANVHTLSDRTDNLSLNVLRDMGARYWYPLTSKSAWESDWRADIDLIIDTIGNSNYYPSFYTVLTTRGRLVRLHTTSCEKKFDTFSTVAPAPGRLQTLKNTMTMKDYKQRVIKDKTVDYNIFSSYEDDKDLFQADLASLRRLLRVGKIGPKIVSRVGFDKLEGEWRKMMEEDGGIMSRGIIVVHPWNGS